MIDFEKLGKLYIEDARRTLEIRPKKSDIAVSGLKLAWKRD